MRRNVECDVLIRAFDACLDTNADDEQPKSTLPVSLGCLGERDMFLCLTMGKFAHVMCIFTTAQTVIVEFKRDTLLFWFPAG